MILTLAEMQKRVLEKSDLKRSENLTQANKVIDWIDNRYEQIYRSYPWPQIQDDYALTSVNGQTDYALRRDVDEIMDVVDLSIGKVLTNRSVLEHAQFVAIFDDLVGEQKEGQPDGFRVLNVLTTKELMTAADTVEVVSSDNTDLTPNAVRIRGLVSGTEVEEEIVLTGTTAATSTNTYDSGTALHISLGANDGTDTSVSGTITVRETIDNTKVKSIIALGDSATEYTWIALDPKPPSTGDLNTVIIFFRKKRNILRNPNDIPLFGISLELIEGAYADLLFNDSDPRYQAQESRFISSVAGKYREISKKFNHKVKFRPRTDTMRITNKDLFLLRTVVN